MRAGYISTRKTGAPQPAQHVPYDERNVLPVRPDDIVLVPLLRTGGIGLVLGLVPAGDWSRWLPLPGSRNEISCKGAETGSLAPPGVHVYHVHVLVLPCPCPVWCLHHLGLHANMEDTGGGRGAQGRVFPLRLYASRRRGPLCMLCCPSSVQTVPVVMRGVICVTIVCYCARNKNSCRVEKVSCLVSTPVLAAGIGRTPGARPRMRRMLHNTRVVVYVPEDLGGARACVAMATARALATSAWHMQSTPRGARASASASQHE